MRFYDLQLSEARLRVWEMGRPQDPPVLLLHGGGVDHARLSWEDTMQHLAALGLLAIVPDLAGYGASPYPQRPVTLAYLRASVCELLDTLGLSALPVCGVSMGGGVALALALSEPARVSRLVLVGSYGLSSYVPTGRWAAALVKLPQPKCLNNWLSHSPLLLELTLSSILKNPAARTPALRQMLAEAMRRSTPAWSDFQRSEVTPTGLDTNFAPQLSNLQMPVLVFHGASDFMVPAQDVQRAFANVPDARVHLLAHAGHWTQRDASSEFHFHLTQFLFKEFV